MRYERLKDIMDLAIRLQGTRAGITLDDIRQELSVSRRTAERLRDTVEWVFGPLETVPADDKRVHWRLRSPALRRLISFTAEELATLATAATTLERANLQEQAVQLRDIGNKLLATQDTKAMGRLEADLETLMQAEGLAMRPGPRQPIDTALISLLREAILTCRTVEFLYLAGSTGRATRQRVEPYGLLYGNRTFLIGPTDWGDEPRLWRLANIDDAELTNERFQRDPDFDLQRYSRRSFGTFQEKPVQVVLHFDAKAASDASSFLFHPEQVIEKNDDGTITVRFKAGGINEMCWHLITWGESVIVEKPVKLRRRLAGMCASLAAHHGEDANP